MSILVHQHGRRSDVHSLCIYRGKGRVTAASDEVMMIKPASASGIQTKVQSVRGPAVALSITIESFLEIPPLALHHSPKKPYRQAIMVSFKLTSLALAAFSTLGAVAQIPEGIKVNQSHKS
jgi:hypothetical protein